MAVAALALLPGVASAQAGSPPPAPQVLGEVIQRPAPAVLAETLPRTGSNVIPMVVGAVALLLVGTVLIVGTRRRRDDSASPA